ncbi:hypothetical protein SUGI_0216610 [Cryptomeria japonica]|nr:hypothetical protein SUGI_0216610 [Cryptomeria japonica]
MAFVSTTNATEVVVLPSDEEFPDELPLSHPWVIDRIRNFNINLRTYTYHGQYRESRGMRDEEAAEILGSPTSWIEGLEEGEQIDCPICLDSIQRGDQVKALACKHVYHYACILRSTKIKQQCPLCRASYDYREAQSE